MLSSANLLDINGVAFLIYGSIYGSVQCELFECDECKTTPGGRSGFDHRFYRITCSRGDPALDDLAVFETVPCEAAVERDGFAGRCVSPRPGVSHGDFVVLWYHPLDRDLEIRNQFPHRVVETSEFFETVAGRPVEHQVFTVALEISFASVRVVVVVDRFAENVHVVLFGHTTQCRTERRYFPIVSAAG